MSLQDSIQSTEEALIELLDAKRGITDATGKGAATENLVERELLIPYLPIGFRCLKGAVVASGAPDQQSPAIDRVVYEPAVAPPLLFDEALPADSHWRPETIAKALRGQQLELGSPTHLHGLYVLGIGYFETVAIESGEPAYRISAWTGADRLFRFANSFRQSFQRWQPLPPIWSADLDGYVHGEARILAE